MQSELAECLLEAKALLHIAEPRQDAALVDVAKRIEVIVRDIANGIAWRAVGFDRAYIEAQGTKHRGGNIDNTLALNLDEAKRIVKDKGVLVIVNDMTTVLRYGDLTLVDPFRSDRRIECQENKFGDAAKRGVKVHR